MQTDTIAIKMKPKTIDDENRRYYRFHIVLDFYSGNEDGSIGQIRVQMKSRMKVNHKITVIDWKNRGENFSLCSIEATSQLTKLAAGKGDMILTSDASGNLKVQLSANKTCENDSIKAKINLSKARGKHSDEEWQNNSGPKGGENDKDDSDEDGQNNSGPNGKEDDKEDSDAD